MRRPPAGAGMLAALALALALALAPAPAPALAQTTPGSTTAGRPADPNALVSPATLDRPPPLYRRSANDAMAIADRLPDVRAERARHRGSHRQAYQKGFGRWQVSYFAPGRERREIAQVLIDDATGAVLEHWTGYKVAWTMARGYPGAFGRKVNDPWVWISLSVLFVVPFVDPRRLRRLWHLDLLALSSFSISLAYFNAAEIDTSVPLAYPPLAYLLVRMVAVALGRGRDGPPLRPLVPTAWLAVALVFLVGFRVGLNVTDSNVIDVGYAGVIGADRLVSAEPLYGGFPSDNERGDTYGPVVYESYVPFVETLGWSGRWDDLPAAHGAALAFDLLALALLFGVGRRIRGPDLGIALAYAWAAFPFTLYALSTNTNDSLVAVTVLMALLFAGRPALRGAAAALAGLTKFAPLALVPVLATHDLRARGQGGGSVRRIALFAAGFVLTAVAVCAPLLGEDVSTFYERTIAYQADRGSPFSIWGLYGWTTAQRVVQGLAVGLAVVLALVPRRRDVAGLAAACAAILIGLQLGVTHWFYLYIVWFFPLVLLALLGRQRS